MSAADDDGDVMSAIAFAESGDWETARELAPVPRPGGLAAWIERHLLAAALAEDGLVEEALRVLGAAPSLPPPPEEDLLDTVLRSHGLRMCCGVLSPATLGARR